MILSNNTSNTYNTLEKFNTLEESWSFDDLLFATKGEWLLKPISPVNNFSIDSRTIDENDVFIAIKGDKHDGHEFINQVIAKKASVVIGSIFSNENLNYAQNYNKPKITGCLKVFDTILSLQNLARYHRCRHKAKFIGLTGSNGKTTTKAMLLHLFSAITDSYASQGNLNNHIGLPLELIRIPLNKKIAILEMGMNHLGEIRFLNQFVKPEISVITSIGPAHIGNLGSLENIAHAKSEILEHLSFSDYAILPADSEFTQLLESKTIAKVLKFGLSSNADLQAQILEEKPNYLKAFINLQNQEQAILELHIPGQHNLSNALAALLTFVVAGNKLSDGVQILKSFKPVSLRLETYELSDKTTFIIDCYNANPSSMQEAIKLLSKYNRTKVAVLGDMKELGNFSEKYHREIGKLVAQNNIDYLVAVGADAKFIADEAIKVGSKSSNVYFVESNQKAVEVLKTIIKPESVILFKASRSMHFEEIIKFLLPNINLDLH